MIELIPMSRRKNIIILKTASFWYKLNILGKCGAFKGFDRLCPTFILLVFGYNGRRPKRLPEIAPSNDCLNIRYLVLFIMRIPGV